MSHNIPGSGIAAVTKKAKFPALLKPMVQWEKTKKKKKTHQQVNKMTPGRDYALKNKVYDEIDWAGDEGKFESEEIGLRRGQWAEI